MRLIGGGAEAALPVGFVVLIVALEPDNLAVALDMNVSLRTRPIINVEQSNQALLQSSDDVSRRRTDQVPPGQVLEQNPPADRQVDEGTAVDIVLSQAPAPVTVPRLDGLTVAGAQAALEAIGLRLGDQSTENSETVNDGLIISQSPAAGQEVPKDTAVDIVVSAGPSVIIVDDVTCLTFSNAKARLEGAGLVVQLGDPVTPRPECPNSVNVAQQDTAPGTAVPPGTTIVLHQGAPPSPSPSASP